MAKISTKDYVQLFKTFRDKNHKNGVWDNPDFKLGAAFLDTVNAQCGKENFGKGEEGYKDLKSKHAGVRAKIRKGLQDPIYAKYLVTTTGRNDNTENLSVSERADFQREKAASVEKVNNAIPTLPPWKQGGRGGAKAISAQELLNLLK